MPRMSGSFIEFNRTVKEFGLLYRELIACPNHELCLTYERCRMEANWSTELPVEKPCVLLFRSAHCGEVILFRLSPCC